MDKAFTSIEEMGSHIREYLNIRIRAIKLNTAEKAAEELTHLIAKAKVMLYFLVAYAMPCLA